MCHYGLAQFSGSTISIVGGPVFNGPEFGGAHASGNGTTQYRTRTEGTGGSDAVGYVVNWLISCPRFRVLEDVVAVHMKSTLPPPDQNDVGTVCCPSQATASRIRMR